MEKNVTNNKIFLSVTAPAYNEEANIEAVIRDWESVLDKFTFVSEIVLGNDGSTDRTKEILEKLGHEYPNLRILHLGKNSGYGTALFTAISASKGEYVVTIDSDGQFELSDFTRLLRECIDKQYDAVTGYRIGKKDSLLRVGADRLLNLIVRVLFDLRYKDTNCAMKIFKGELIRKMKIEATAYPTPTEILIRLKEQGCRIGEIPIQHKKRMGGKSHLKLFQTGWSMLLFLIYMRFKLSLKKTQVITKI